ncbi:DSN1 protein, partial [Halcyon senegalensis]|nr:DSN1 protein [Halcyon senegalensis]
QAKRRSWSRLSLKGTKRRKSLPPVHRDVTELSKSISLDLPETERLAALLLASFQFSAQKLEHSLKQSDGFSPEAFKVQVDSVSQDLKHFVQKLNRDGTLKNCVDNPNGSFGVDSTWFRFVVRREKLRLQPWSLLRRFSTECRAWDQLLLQHQQSAEEMSRQLEESRRNGGRAEPGDYLQTSQAEVLRSKPNYQQILDEQREVLSCMELVVSWAWAFEGKTGIEERVGTFRQLENSPVRKLIAGPPRKIPPPA